MNYSRVETIEGMERLLKKTARARCYGTIEARPRRYMLVELGTVVGGPYSSAEWAAERNRRAGDLAKRIWAETCKARGVSALHGWHYCTEYYDTEGRRWAGGWYSGTTFLGSSVPAIVAAHAMRGGGQ